MTKQEYRTVRDLAWLILINSKSNSLPIEIEKIGKLYDLSAFISPAKSRYDNCLTVCSEILKLYGMNYRTDFARHLTNRVMAPAIVLRELNISSAEELASITDIPIGIAEHRFSRLQQLIQRDKFETSNMESIVLSQFKSWIENINHN